MFHEEPMKKFILSFFFLGFFGVVALVLAVPMVIRLYGPDLIPDSEPPSGLPLGARDFPIPEVSSVAIRLDLPMEALRKVARDNLPPEVKGFERMNFHPKITEGAINWRINPQSLQLENTGEGLFFRVPFSGGADSTGRFGRLRIRVKGNAKMNGSLSGNLSPVVTPDWRIVPRLHSDFRVNQAVIQLGKLGSIEAKDDVQRVAGLMVRKRLAEVEPGLNESVNLRQGITKLWSQAHVIKRASSAPESWVVFDPNRLSMSPIDYSDRNHLSLTVEISGQSFVTNTEPGLRDPEPLPLLETKTVEPELNLRIPIIVNLEALNRALSEKVYPIKTAFGPTFELSKPALALGENEKLLLDVDIRSVSGCPLPIEGRASLEARPIVDCRHQTLGFTNLSFSVDCGAALTDRAICLCREIIVKAVEKELRLDLKEHLPEVENEIVNIIASAPVPDQFELTCEEPQVRVLGAYTVERNGWNRQASPGIVFVLGATGRIHVKVRELKAAISI